MKTSGIEFAFALTIEQGTVGSCDFDGSFWIGNGEIERRVGINIKGRKVAACIDSHIRPSRLRIASSTLELLVLRADPGSIKRALTNNWHSR